MIFKHTKKLCLLIITLLATSPAFSMLILKQEKKHSPARYALEHRKINDHQLPKQEDREIFETIITVGKVVVQNVGVITQSVHTAVTLVGANLLHKVITGEYLTDRLHRNEKKEEKRFNELCKFKSNPYNLDREDLDYMESENFPKNYDGTYSYKIERDKNYMRGYRFDPDHDHVVGYDTLFQTTSLDPAFLKSNYVKNEPEVPLHQSSIPATTEIVTSKGCFPESITQDLSEKGCFPIQNSTEIPSQGCFTENVKNNQPEGCFNEGELVKIPSTFRYEGQIKPGDVFFPDVPRREDGFKSHIKKGKIKKEVHKNGQRGFKDKKGNWWIPSGKNGSAHGGEHWDLIDSDGKHLDNIYPGGKIRNGEISKYTLWCEALPIQEIKTVPEKTFYGNFSVSESVHHAASVTNEVIHRWEPNDNWTDKQREIYNKIERARSSTRDDVKEFTPACSLEEYYKHFGSTKYDSGVTLSPEAQELYDSPDFMDRLQQMSEDAGLLKDTQENPFEKFKHAFQEEEKSNHKEENILKKEDNFPKEANKDEKSEDKRPVEKKSVEKKEEISINKYRASLNYQHNKEIYGEDMGNYGNNYGYQYNPHTRQTTYKQYNRNTISAYESCIKYYSYLNCESIKNRE